MRARGTPRTIGATVVGIASLIGCGGAASSPAPSAPPARASAEADAPKLERCGERAAVALQVLGSGGPIPDDDRASAGYLVWIDGKARALIDLGGGSMVRFGASGAKIADLDVVVLSHLHVDHAGDLPALLKGAYFARRTRPLVVAGPTGNDRFPATTDHTRALFAPETGAFRYLSGFLTGDEDFAIEVRDVPADAAAPATIVDGERLRVEAVGVHHGSIPALGIQIRVGNRRIVFGGDQSARTPEAFAAMAAGADLLVAHHALPEEGFEGVRHLHRVPSEIGDLAAAVDPGALVLSHHMQRALRDLAGAKRAIRARWDGAIHVADDGRCYPLADSSR